MSKIYRRSAISLIALAFSTTAIAGDTPLYEPAPEWVDNIELATIERDPANSQILNDTQIRIEDGLHWEYTDLVYRIGSVADLTSSGTLKAQWLPDKGDLIVHEISIRRDGEIIDLVAAGETLEILRREQLLEMQIIDGSLTATLAVPGLEVGDELRMRYSVTTSDQALGKEVQSQTFLWRDPLQVADFARVRASWPENLDVFYKAGPNFDAPPVAVEEGYEWLEVSLPLEEADELPHDAPLRYKRGTILQIGTFADWAEVSSTMAPYYKTVGALDGIPDLIQRVDAIKARHTTELARAVAALELVQEDVRYLLNGLDGGNYLPQDVATTWDKKYGDCKAKTVILLAILNRLGISSEAVLVSSRGGNAVPISLPVPGAFDHVLVRANIDGELYYLDGTSLGANIDVVGNVPPFEYALPIRDSGADLEKIEQTLPRYPDMRMEMTVDVSAGGDLPSLVVAKMHFRGAGAAQINAQADKLTDDRKRMLGRGMGQDLELLEMEIIEGEDDSIATIEMTGIMQPFFEFDGVRGETDPNVLSDRIKFSPDRSRREWRDIPATIGAPSKMEVSVEAVLPDGVTGYEIRGDEALEIEVAGRRYTRRIQVDEGQLAFSESVTSKGGEIAPDAFVEERQAAARLARESLTLIAPKDMPRIWRFAGKDDRSELAALEEAYAKLIENDPDEADPYLSRAAFRFDTFDFAGSLEDMNSVVELEGTAEYYGQRATVHAKLLDMKSAKKDLAEAFALDPSAGRATELAWAMLELGDLAGARELLEQQDGDESVQEDLAVSLAEIDAMEGQAVAGLERLRAIMVDKPNDSSLLNNSCWFMGTWQIEVSEGLSICTKAVENSGSSGQILDSRAMIYLRNGMLDQALEDIEEALDIAPEQSASVLLRGIIRLAKGDKDGQRDIDEAIARDPELRTRYRRWGFDI